VPTPLRAFLMLRTDAGEWSVTVHRDLEDLLASWKARRAGDGVTGVVHVGFDRPPSREFDALASTRPGRVLITSAAKFALPADFKTSKAPLGVVSAIPVFLATRGWDYLAEDDVAATGVDESGHARRAEGWVQDFLNTTPDAVAVLAAIDIFNEADYRAREADLPGALRHQIGLYRFEKLVGSRRADPCEFARAAPPWLAERALDTVDLSVRVAHVFASMGVATVGDLAGLSIGDLLDQRNFGRRSVEDLVGSLEGALREGPPHGPDEVGPDRLTLLDMVRHTLSEVDGRVREVLHRRIGLNRPEETLAEIGDDYGVTPERIRQIEAAALTRVRHEQDWTGLLTAKLTPLLRDRSFPLPLLGLEGADPWFTGIGQAPGVLAYILDNFCERSARIVTIDQIEYLGLLTQDDWEATLQKARRLLAGGAGKGWFENHCRSLVEGLLPNNAPDFKDVLWEHASALCHFTPDAEGVLVLASYGRGVEHYVHAVLSESDCTLHFSEIAALASARSGREIDVRRAHGAAASVGLLLGRGSYGLDRHLPLDPPALQELAEAAEEVVLEGSPGRQWHASEILAALIECGNLSALSADKYVIEIALRRSGTLEGLGRMVWTRGPNEAEESAARIDVRQAIIAILQQAGRPLRAHEIRHRLIALRGVNETFQISAGDPLIRVGPALWGLNDRDLPVKRAEQPWLMDQLVDELRRSGTGIHVSELDRRLDLPTGLSPTMVATLCAADSRMRINVAQYMYLAEWGEPRRESIGDATKVILSSAEAPLSFDEIAERVTARVRRPCDRQAISASLRDCEAEYDGATGRWLRNKTSDSLIDDDLEIAASVR
jgi:hypothetical protein